MFSQSFLLSLNSIEYTLMSDNTLNNRLITLLPQLLQARQLLKMCEQCDRDWQ
jgi:hypothetical protein